MIGRVIIGILISVSGFLIVWKTEFVYRAVGRIPTGEKLFGSGGTRFFLKLLGIIIIFVGFFVITNYHEKILNAIFGKIF
ncbi:MAG: hypothetical protein ACOZBH_02815 [Patescibacteria group bacterium]